MKNLLPISKVISPLLFLTVISNSLCSQSSSPMKLYTSIRVVDELTLGFSYPIKSNLNLALELGYNLKYKKSTYSETGSFIRPDRLNISLVDQGPLARGSLWILLNEKNCVSLSYVFRWLTADKLIYDPGLWGGSTMSEYAEYSSTSSNHGFEANFNRIIKKFTLYAGFGYRHASTWKYYDLEGLVDMHFPSDREENVKENYLVINLGLKFALYEW